MYITGYHCPKCGKEFQICKPTSSKLMGICPTCDLICYIESYSSFQQRVAMLRTKMKSQMGYVPYTIQKQIINEVDLKQELEKKREEEFNPSKRAKVEEKRSQ